MIAACHVCFKRNYGKIEWERDCMNVDFVCGMVLSCWDDFD